MTLGDEVMAAAAAVLRHPSISNVASSNNTQQVSQSLLARHCVYLRLEFHYLLQFIALFD
jgi:hypothetical protein